MELSIMVLFIQMFFAGYFFIEFVMDTKAPAPPEYRILLALAFLSFAMDTVLNIVKDIVS